MIQNTQIILQAEDGKYLTDGKTIVTIVYLGKWDKPENWREITAEEKEALEKEWEEEVSENE